MVDLMGNPVLYSAVIIVLASVVFIVGYAVLQKVADILRNFMAGIGINQQHANAFITVFISLAILEIMGMTIMLLGDIGSLFQIPSVGQIGSIITSVASGGYALILPVTLIYVAYVVMRRQ